MKRLSLITTLLLLFSIAHGQQNDPLFKTDADGKIYYSEIIEMPPVFTPEILQKRAKNYIVKAFKNPKEVLQIDTKEQIVVVGIMEYSMKVPLNGILDYPMRFTFIVNFKDNKFKYEFAKVKNVAVPTKYNNYLTGDYPMEEFVFAKKKDGSYAELTTRQRNGVAKSINNFLASFKDAMYTRDDFYEPESTKGFEKPKTQVEVKKEEKVVTTTQPKKEEKPFITEKPNTPTDANKLAVNAYKKDNGIFFEFSFNADKVCTQKNSKMKINFEGNQSLLATNVAESNCKGNLSTFITDVDKLKKLKITSFQIATDKGFKEMTLDDAEKLRSQIENLLK